MLYTLLSEILLWYNNSMDNSNMDNIVDMAPLDKGPLLMRQWQLRQKPTPEHPQFWDVVYWWSKIGYYNPDDEPEYALLAATLKSDRVIFSCAALIRSRPPQGIQRPDDTLKYVQEKVEQNLCPAEIGAWREALKNNDSLIMYRLLFQKQHVDKQTQHVVIQDTDVSFDNAIEYMVQNLAPPNNPLIHMWDLCGDTLRTTLKTIKHNHDSYMFSTPDQTLNLNILE